MSDVYISHAPGDDAIATRIYFAFSFAGISTWVDHVHGTEPETALTRQDEQALNRCEFGLFILSAASIESHKCTIEWETFLQAGKRLFVAIAEQIPPDDLPDPLWVRGIPYIDLTSDVETGLIELIRVIAGQTSS